MPAWHDRAKLYSCQCTDPTQRFSSRVDNYVRYRPGYPSAVIDLLRKECGLTPNSVIADVASGTGIFTRMLLENGNRVFGVEPNLEMRKAGEEYLAAYPNFTSVAGTAEATTLADHSVDFVTAAQAAHWFDRPRGAARIHPHSEGLMDGAYCSGTSGALIRRRFSVNTNSCC